MKDAEEDPAQIRSLAVSFLALTLGMTLKSRKLPPESARANELFYDAMEARSADRQFEMLSQVIELDPAHADANLVMLGHLDLTLEEEIGLVRQIVELAAKRLGKKAFKELHGAFWGFMETRPYMRARQQLANCLREADMPAEAMAEWQAMLELNPNDNQGVRYELLGVALQAGDLDTAEKLFDRYEELDFSVVFAWGHVLWLWLKERRKEAGKALAAAMAQNPFILPYLTGKKRLPKRLPGSYAIGSKEEAICYASDLAAAWKSHPEALNWLKQARG